MHFNIALISSSYSTVLWLLMYIDYYIITVYRYIDYYIITVYRYIDYYI